MFKQAWESIRNIFISKGSKFRNNFLLVAKANILAQALPIIAAPITSRLYSPTDFGIYAIFSSILGLLSPLTTWKIEWSVPNARTRQQAAAMLSWGAIVLCITCVFITFIVLNPGNIINLWTGLIPVSPYLFWLPIVLLGSGLQQLLQSWHIRENDLSPVSEAKIKQTTASTTSQVILGFFNSGPHGLIIGGIFSSWIGIGALYNRAQGLLSSACRATLHRLTTTLKRFCGETTNSTGAALVNTASLTALPLLMAHYFSPREVGMYALMQRLTISPISLITSALGQSFWAEAARQVKSNPSSLKQLYLRTTKKLLLIASIFSLCCFTAPLFVGLAFGNQWEPAGMILIACIPQLFGQIIVSPLSHLLVHKKQHWQFWWDVARFFLIISIAITLGTRGASIYLFTLSISLASGFMYLLVFCLNLLAYPANR